MAYDMAAVLNRGQQVPNSTYDAAVSAFGVQGVAEIAYFVGCYCLISSLLNTFDVNLPGTEPVSYTHLASPQPSTMLSTR